MTDKTKSLLIIDGYGFIFRAYHVQPPLTSPNGIPVGAIYGFTSMLIKLISDFKPEQAVVVLDSGQKNFRHQIYPQYKANRPPAPDDLIPQLKLVQTAAKALNFTVMNKEGFEADDIIATLAKKATEQKEDAVIVSSDKDLMQLINHHVTMYDPVKAKYISPEDVEAKFGVRPERVREVQALMGDSSDNIPGVRGIGPKSASKLINDFDTVENLLASITQVANKRQQQLLLDNKENALISWQLVGLDDKVDVDFNIEKFKWTTPDHETISSFLNEHGFRSLHKRTENLFNIKIQSDGSKLEKNKQVKAIQTINIETEQQFAQMLAQIETQGIVAVNLIKENDNHQVVFAVDHSIYITDYLQEEIQTKDLFTFSNEENHKANLNRQINDLLADSAIKKVTFDLKKLLKFFAGNLYAFDDLQLMDYCLTAGTKSKKLPDLIKHYDQTKNEDYNPDDVAITADFIDCYHLIKQELYLNKALHLYQEIDLPICYILHDMEQTGIKIDTGYLRNLSKEFGNEIAKIEQEIFAIARKEFNIASPKQLGEILFDEMKLPFAKISGKSKTYSTNADILEKLSFEGYQIADLVLKYRHLSKLKNTYTDVLPKLTQNKDSRIHTTFLQTSTTTGRLSSHEPNVQNIPIRTTEGNKIRAAFIAKEGHKLISADYSQIELRILSHVANIAQLKQAFADDLDIHAHTASQVFAIKADEVTPDMRRNAKAINFGIIYGISAFGLARQLGIGKKEAGDYIDRYFQEYPGIKEYMDKTIEFAQKHGYVENELGRKCFLPTINNKNHALRSFAERAAINAPMQSLAADIAKIAMINVDKALKAKSMKTKMILQIHDELIFEAPKEEVDTAIKIIKNSMENAYLLDVPTITGASSGNNWQEIH